ncbi:hypothetical protein K525DRAFT_288008 [Schizophyllum commune Loenen D]|nr:hypothetical protein K525DRAFT_288008 [Schizophyllum commune Loenen D]
MRSLENWHPRPEFASALTTLGSKSLVELRVDASLTSKKVEDAITEILRQSPALEVVELRHMISPDRILALAALRSLRELRIMRLPVFDEELPKPAFPALRSLYFNWTRHAALMNFLHKIGDVLPNLDSLTLGFRPSDALNGLGELTALCELVAKRCSAVGLAHLSIADETGGDFDTTSDEVQYYAAKYEHIRALRSLRGLKTLHIEVWGHVDVDDNDIELLVSSWPVLESFRLDKPTESVYEFDTDVEGAHPFVPRATAKSLLSIARHCPDLRELAMAFNASDLTTIESGGRPGGGLVQHALRKLDTLHTIIQPDEALPLTLLLSDAFPALEKVDSDTELQAEVAKEEGEGIPEGHEGYKKLLELLPIVSKVRWQERLAIKAPRI